MSYQIKKIISIEILLKNAFFIIKLSLIICEISYILYEITILKVLLWYDILKKRRKAWKEQKETQKFFLKEREK